MPITRLALHCMICPIPDETIAKTIGLSAPGLSNCMVGRRILPPMRLMDLAWLLECDPEDLVGWANDGIDTSDLSAELPCLETGVDTDMPPKPGPGGRPV